VRVPARKTAEETVPALYFRKDFNLEHPATFDAVFPEHLVQAKGGGGGLQEDLSTHLDIVEEELSNRLGERHELFFRAVDQQQSLNLELENMMQRIRTMRERLRGVSHNASNPNLRTLQQMIARQNYDKLDQKLDTLVAVNQTQGTIQLLLATEDYIGALDLITATQEVLRTELTGLHCLRHLSSQLTEMQKMVFALLEQGFVHSAVENLAGFCDPDNLGWTRILDGNVELQDEELEGKSVKISPLISSMLCENKLDLVTPYRREVLGSKGPPARPGLLNDVLRQSVARFLVGLSAENSNGTRAAGSAASSTGKDLSLVERLCTLPVDSWHVGLNCIFRDLLEALIRIKVMHKCICIGVDDAAGSPVTTPPALSPSLGGAASTVNATGSLSAPSTPVRPTPARGSSTPQHRSATATPDLNAHDAVGLPDDEDMFQDTEVKSSAEIASLEHGDMMALLSGKSTGSAPSVDDRAGSASPGTEPTAANIGGEVGSVSSSSSGSTSPAEQALPTLFVPTHRRGASGASSVELGAVNSGPSAADLQRIRDASQRLLVDTCNEMHSRCSRLILKRKHDNVEMSIFMREFELASAFVSKTEAISGRKCTVLSGTMDKKAKELVERFHAKQREKIVSHLTNELWEQRDVPQEFQLVVDSICVLKASAGLPSSPSKGPSVSKTLNVGTDKFLAVNAILMFALMLKDYLLCAQEMPQIANEVLNHTVNCIRLFNEKTKKLVLLGEAEQTGLMKRILSKHLALASQTLSAIMALMVFLRKAFLNILPTKMQGIVNKNFDKVEADFEAHLKEIMSIFVQQIEGVWNHHSAEMKWSTLSVTPGARKVANDIGRLNKALKPNLPTSTLRTVFVNVLGSVNQKLRAVLGQSGIKKSVTVGIAADVVHYEEVLGGIEGMPIECLREGLAELGLKLPALIRAASLAGPK
jgi:vacuolar protein sorting-associated protein 54